jgi:hypothetical protein
MKIIAVLIIITGLLIGTIPLFTDCESQGRAIKLPDGRLIAMKCHWTGRAELALALPIVAVGGLLAFGRRRELRRNLGILGMILGAAVILVPVALIGVCASSDMLCNSVMQPALILLGTLIMAFSLVNVAWPGQPMEQAA